MLEERGAWIIPAVRFVPGGRTAVMLAAGTVELTWRSFFVADLVGVLIWGALYTAVGYFGGEAFKESTWAALLVSLGAAALIGAAGWVWYRTQTRD